jgi:hypothetical protein
MDEQSLKQNQDDPSFDVLWGCAAIAKFIGENRRQTFHLLSAGLRPAEKIGNQWFSTRERLRARFRGNGGLEMLPIGLLFEE